MPFTYKSSVTLTATKTKIWSTLWSPETYKVWTAPFAPPGVDGSGSQIEGDVSKVGNKIYFTDGKGSGMVALVDQYKKLDHIVFKHIGVLQDKKEILEGKEVDAWKNSLEAYYIKKSTGKTWELQVEMTGPEENEMTKYLQDIWPKALVIFKDLCEKEETKKETDRPKRKSKGSEEKEEVTQEVKKKK